MDDEFLATLTSTSRSERPESPHLWPLILLTLGLLIVAVLFIGAHDAAPLAVSSGTPLVTPEREPRVYTVSYRFGVFSPTNLRIHEGDTVRWHNESTLPIRVVAQLQVGKRVPEFDSIGPIQPDGFFAYTFGSVGVFGYENAADAHESGTILVR